MAGAVDVGEVDVGDSTVGGGVEVSVVGGLAGEFNDGVRPSASAASTGASLVPVMVIVTGWVEKRPLLSVTVTL